MTPNKKRKEPKWNDYYIINKKLNKIYIPAVVANGINGLKSEIHELFKITNFTSLFALLISTMPGGKRSYNNFKFNNFTNTCLGKDK